MSGLLQKILGGQSPAAAPNAAVEDADFADFAGVPEPSPASIAPSAISSSPVQSALPTGQSTVIARPYTKWYRVWERTSPSDFYVEMAIIPFLLLLTAIHLWGARKNKRKAKAWVAAHARPINEEFASFGYSGNKMPELDKEQAAALSDALKIDSLDFPLLSQKSANEFESYATGRANVAFLDVKLTMVKRYNPMFRFVEATSNFFFDSVFPGTEERMEATSYVFDGRESELVPVLSAEVEGKALRSKDNSAYDAFVWAIVHKDRMRKLRDIRYDLSLTTTKDHPKLPDWVTVMSESAEITETILSPDLVDAIRAAGDSFEALIVSDMPVDQPRKIEEMTPRKRVSLFILIPASDNYASSIPVFKAFLRLPDKLVSSAHFRPEVLRRIKATRDEEIRKIKKVSDDDKAEDRRLKAEKERKDRRDAALKGMTAEQQRKFLEKERAKDLRKSQARRTVKG